MAYHHFSIKKLDDAEKLLPGFRKLWKQIKQECGTKQARPKSITFRDSPNKFIPHDHDLARRFALNLETMKLSPGLHVSSGEWACHGGSNNDEAISVPSGMAVLNCSWSDYYRTFSIDIQVAPGCIPKQIDK